MTLHTHTAAVLSMLTRAGIPEHCIDLRTIDYFLRHGYLPHQILRDVYRVDMATIVPKGRPS